MHFDCDIIPKQNWVHGALLKWIVNDNAIVADQRLFAAGHLFPVDAVVYNFGHTDEVNARAAVRQ